MEKVWTKECRREYMKNWRKKNSAHIQNYFQQWRLRNRDHMKYLLQNWREKNPEKVKKHMKKESGYYEKRDKKGNLKAFGIGNKKGHIQFERGKISFKGVSLLGNSSFNNTKKR